MIFYLTLWGSASRITVEEFLRILLQSIIADAKIDSPLRGQDENGLSTIFSYPPCPLARQTPPLRYPLKSYYNFVFYPAILGNRSWISPPSGSPLEF
jgi:hypothetical protein